MLVLWTTRRIVRRLLRLLNSRHVRQLVRGFRSHSRACATRVRTVSWRLVLEWTRAVTWAIASFNRQRRIASVLLLPLVAARTVVWWLDAVSSRYTRTVVRRFHWSLWTVVRRCRWIYRHARTVTWAVVWLNLTCLLLVVWRLPRVWTVVRTLRLTSRADYPRWLHVGRWRQLIRICIVNRACIMVIDRWLHLDSITVSGTCGRPIRGTLGIHVWRAVRGTRHHIESRGESCFILWRTSSSVRRSVLWIPTLGTIRGVLDTWGETHIPSLIVHHRGSRPVQLILVLLVVFRIFTQHSEINHQVESSRADRGHLPHYNILCHAF